MLPFAMTAFPEQEMALLRRLYARDDPDVARVLALLEGEAEALNEQECEYESLREEHDALRCRVGGGSSDPNAGRTPALWPDPGDPWWNYRTLETLHDRLVCESDALAARHAALLERYRTLEAEHVALAEEHRLLAVARSRLQQGGRRAFGSREGEGERVGEILRLRADGLTLQAIADRLNGAGWRTQTGRLWRAQQVKNVLDRTPVASATDGAGPATVPG